LSTSQICVFLLRLAALLCCWKTSMHCDLSLSGVWVYHFMTCAAFFILLSLWIPTPCHVTRERNHKAMSIFFPKYGFLCKVFTVIYIHKRINKLFLVRFNNNNNINTHGILTIFITRFWQSFLFSSFIWAVLGLNSGHQTC
jgi:hypothetical protein